MKITSVTVSYQRTQSLENYCNVRPGLALTAELDEYDDPEDVTAQLHLEARSFVEEACDRALESNNQPAQFSTEPRFAVWEVLRYGWSPRRFRVTSPEPLVLIVPASATRLSQHWASPVTPGNLRVGHARRVAAQRAETHSFRLIDCSDGDLSRIPAWVFEPVPEPESVAEVEAKAALPFDEADDGDEDEADEAPF